MNMKKFFSFFVLLLSVQIASSQTILSGSVKDSRTAEELAGAIISIPGTQIGTTTDIKGNFKLTLKEENKTPFTMEISSLGYEKKSILVTETGRFIYIKLTPSSIGLSGVEVATDRIKQKQKLNPLTVEQMDLIAIKETPAVSFYDGLGQLKGVDVTAASIGFKVINTRGFNSTSGDRWR